MFVVEKGCQYMKKYNKIYRILKESKKNRDLIFYMSKLFSLCLFAVRLISSLQKK